MHRHGHRWPAPRLTRYAFWLLVSRVGAPIVLLGMALDLALG